MNILITILIILAGLFSLLLILALFMRKEHYVKREVVINAPAKIVFDYLKFLKNQEAFNERAKAGEREKQFTGTDGTVGYIYAWKGDKSAGEGEKEIIDLVEEKKVETEIRFIKPMKVSSRVIMEMEPLSQNQTKVSWSNSGTLPRPFNLLIPTMEKGLPKEMDRSLNTLKTILEK